MRIQLWSYYLSPEPQGVAPLSHRIARELQLQGHNVLAISGHPHYPQPAWGSRKWPYQGVYDGVPVLRLPLWIGRESGAQRIREELTFTLGLGASLPLLPSADVMLVVSPCFPALAPAMLFSKLRRIPWVMWLQDIVTAGAESTGLISNEQLLRAAKVFESSAYRSADSIIAISEGFRSQLLSDGVPADKVVQIFNPSTQAPVQSYSPPPAGTSPRILVMGNVGTSQGLDRIVTSFQANSALAAAGAELVIAGHGVALEQVKLAVRSDRVHLLGVLGHDALEREIRSASVGVVSQRSDIAEFNFPSKLMNYFAHGLPVIASVRPTSETARVVSESKGGWATDAADPDEFARLAAKMVGDGAALASAGQSALAYAKTQFDPRLVAGRIQAVLTSAATRQSDRLV